MALQATARTKWLPSMEIPSAEAEQPALNETIARALDTHHYVIVTGLKVEERMQSSFQELAATFSRLPSPAAEKGDFFCRSNDMGEFVVSSDEVFPYTSELRKRLRVDRYTHIFRNEELYQNAFLLSLLKFACTSLPGEFRPRIVNVELTRHYTSVKALDPHQDNGGDRRDPTLSDYVVLFLIHRSPEGIEGGETQITTDEGHVIAQQLLKDPLDCYFVNDDVHYHAATEITVEEGSVRDVVIMSIKRAVIVV